MIPQSAPGMATGFVQPFWACERKIKVAILHGEFSQSTHDEYYRNFLPDTCLVSGDPQAM